MVNSKRNWILINGLVVLFVLGIALLSQPSPADAKPNAMITVNTLSGVNDGVHCALYQAIVAANTNTAQSGCPAGNVGLDTITFSVAGIIHLNGSLPIITEDLVINGTGITVDAGNVFRTGPDVNPGATATINGLSLINGNFGVGYGGAIANLGTLNLTNCTLANNAASHGGGAIYASNATLNITNCTFSGNQSKASGSANGGSLYISGGQTKIISSTFSNNATIYTGGAIYIDGNARMDISSSTFNSNNTTFSMSSAGGAIAVYSATVMITNTTFANNISSVGSAVFNFQSTNGIITLTNNTIASNTAEPNGGAIRINGGTINLQNSIVANNTGDNCSGAPNDGGYNIQFGGTDNTCGATITTINPSLAPLANYGGPTMTMALITGSPALDQIPAATNGCGTTIKIDQRGSARTGSCDIGAFEGFITALYTYLPFIQK